jgi:hypothetical protein
MARSVEEIQDIALFQMGKITRNNDSQNRPLSLAEQIAREEKMKHRDESLMGWGEWLEELKAKMKARKMRVTNSAFDFITRKYRKEIETLKSTGASHEAMLLIEERAIEWSNV